MKLVLYLFILLLLVMACSADQIPERAYPRVKTNPVTDIQETGATFNAELLAIPIPARDNGVMIGFIFSELEENTTSLELGEVVEYSVFFRPSPFGKAVERSMKPGVRYYVRAFVRMSQLPASANLDPIMVYGNVVEFTSQGSRAPEIWKFEPETATWGDTVAVHGQRFSNLKSSNKVKFGTVECSIALASPELLLVVVPALLRERTSQIAVGFSGKTDVSVATFTLKSPNISTISTSGRVGDIVTVTGNNFNPEHTRVTLGGFEAVIEKLDNKNIVFRIPSALRSSPGRARLLVIAGDGDLFAEEFIPIREGG